MASTCIRKETERTSPSLPRPRTWMDSLTHVLHSPRCIAPAKVEGDGTVQRAVLFFFCGDATVQQHSNWVTVVDRRQC